MDETLRQLGGLLLGSVPTIILFLVAFFAYRFILHGALERVLEERRERTEGAMERARADIAAAEAKTAEYEERLRAARVSVFRAIESRRKEAVESKFKQLADVRAQADERIRQAKAAIAQDVANSKLGLQIEAERLATEIVNTILRQVGVAQYPVGGNHA
jgi:F-type H+-transporting ATPase subunit b